MRETLLCKVFFTSNIKLLQILCQVVYTPTMKNQAKVCKVGEKVTNYVQLHRKRLGVTQQQLAKETALSRQTIIAIEKGNYCPSVLHAIKIANFFKVPLETIFVCGNSEK